MTARDRLTTGTPYEALEGAAHTIRGLDAKLSEIRETCEARIIEDADQLADAIIAIIDRED